MSTETFFIGFSIGSSLTGLLFCLVIIVRSYKAKLNFKLKQCIRCNKLKMAHEYYEQKKLYEKFYFSFFRKYIQAYPHAKKIDLFKQLEYIYFKQK